MATGSEAALWLFGLTALTLVLASLLLLGLLVRSVVADAALGGFMAAIALMIGLLGVGSIGYVLNTAHRAGYLRAFGATETSGPAVVPPGMHVVPALPPDLGWRRRQERAQEQAARARQASAVARIEAEQRATAVAPRTPVPPARPRPAPLRSAAPAVATQPPRAGGRPTPPVVRLPRQAVERASPASSPLPTMPQQRVHPRGQAALLQVRAADVRIARASTAPRPWPPAPGPRRP